VPAESIWPIAARSAARPANAELTGGELRRRGTIHSGRNGGQPLLPDRQRDADHGEEGDRRPGQPGDPTEGAGQRTAGGHVDGDRKQHGQQAGDDPDEHGYLAAAHDRPLSVDGCAQCMIVGEPPKGSSPSPVVDTLGL
jgi:hypothetical protein